MEQLQKQQQKKKTQKRFIQIGAVVAVVLLIGILIAVFHSSGGSSSSSTTTAASDTSTSTDGSTTTVAGATTVPGETTVPGATTVPGETTTAGGATTTPTSASPPTTKYPPPTTVPGQTITGDTPCPKADGSSPRTTSFAKPPPMCIDTSKTYTAEVETNLGNFTMALDAKAAPKTVNNFVVLAQYHFFDGLSFHRIIPDFVVQGGDPNGDGTGGPGYSFDDELPANGAYKLGSVAMANSGANTNGSQFFIITGSQGTALPPQYSLFGQVVDGYDTTVAALAKLGSADGTPTDNAYINKVTITES
jgi:cyclophilin family peptidyl-prolyl cis-trans isomerase